MSADPLPPELEKLLEATEEMSELTPVPRLTAATVLLFAAIIAMGYSLALAFVLMVAAYVLVLLPAKPSRP